MKVTRRQRCSCVHDTLNSRAVPATQHRAELQSDVRERGLNSDW